MSPTDLPSWAAPARGRLALSIRLLQEQLMPDYVPTARRSRGKGLRTKSARRRAELRQSGAAQGRRPAKPKPVTVDADA